jgi:hypothetical protein
LEGKLHGYGKLVRYLEEPISIAPLVTFRIAFGLVMLFSTLRYMWMGWVDTQLVDPLLHFSYFGFEWVKPLGRTGMYIVFVFMAIACVAITLGWFYRFFTLAFFLSFTYVELIDITYYLNHYYFVSIVAFLLIWVPAHRHFSLDVWRKPELRLEKVSRWCIGIFKLQIAVVYCYAGLAKINYDWLFRALPLAIWLPAKTSVPVIGSIFKYKLTAYLFSWAGDAVRYLHHWGTPVSQDPLVGLRGGGGFPYADGHPISDRGFPAGDDHGGDHLLLAGLAREVN